MRHADGDLVDAGARRVGQDVVEQRDQGLAALQREALLAHELRLEELLEGLGADEGAQDVALRLGGGGLVGALDALLDPRALLGILDVHVFDADRARVGVVQAREDVAQQHLVGAAEAAGGEGTVQVPHAQAIGGDVQVGVAAHAVGERVGVGSQVSARAVGVDDLRDAGGLALLAIWVVFVVGLPRVGARGHVQGGEDALVEAVAARQLGVDQAQETARRRALDDAVIVGGGEVHRLADAQGRQALGGDAAELRRVVGGAHANDEALADHQARHRGGRAQRAGVGQRDGGALEVGGRQRGRAGAGDQVLVGVDELREGQGVGVVDDGNLQGVVPLRVGHVDGQAEADVRELFDGRLGALHRVAHVQVGHFAQRLDQGVADEVREGDFAADGARQVGVDQGAVFDEELGGDLTLGGGCGDRERGLHVLGGRACGGLQDTQLVLDGCSVGAGEGGTSVRQARVGAGGLGHRGGRGGGQVGAGHGDDGGGYASRLRFLLLDVEGGRGDAHGHLGGGPHCRGLGGLGGFALLERAGNGLGDGGAGGAQLRGSRFGREIGAPRGVEQLRITLVQVAHLREVPLRIGLGNCVSGHVFLRLTHAACMGLLRGDRTGQILPPRDHLHETWATLGDHFKGLWSFIGRVLAQHRDVWKCALGRWSLPAKLDASWTATLLALPPLFPAPCLRVCARPAPASSIGGSIDDRSHAPAWRRLDRRDLRVRLRRVLPCCGRSGRP